LDTIQLGQLVEADFFIKFKTPTPIPIGVFPNGFSFVRPGLCFQALIGSHLHGDILLTELNSKWFHNRVLIPLENLPSDYLQASKASCNTFWRSRMPYQARTIFWRIYHKKQPCRSRLYRLIPQRFVNDGCLLCVVIENDEHFLWSCPLKQPAWKRVLSRFLPRPFTFNFGTVALPSHTNTKLPPYWSFDLQTFIACSLLNLWKFVFGHAPFWPREAASRTSFMLRRIDRKNRL
jgi:hypothetical protein